MVKGAFNCSLKYMRWGTSGVREPNLPVTRLQLGLADLASSNLTQKKKKKKKPDSLPRHFQLQALGPEHSSHADGKAVCRGRSLGNIPHSCSTEYSIKKKKLHDCNDRVWFLSDAKTANQPVRVTVTRKRLHYYYYFKLRP